MVNFLLIGIAEALHHFPHMESFNAFGFEQFGLQISCLLVGILLYAWLTFWAMKQPCVDFEKLDL